MGKVQKGGTKNYQLRLEGGNVPSVTNSSLGSNDLLLFVNSVIYTASVLYNNILNFDFL